ncbi:hypothetical protein PYV02_01435 [Leifsonia sp. H3M29-4]|uniref:hypothetical protein n=1 Tax=Salinibacterium metalliresistens TaxID=3031321 RepID=UPI0023DB4467|nr:hypothetical protein [Salinibacterium metalliresistens]MDF1477741.1 hypothetical protein [Salinibacterium metalliresistens]
MTTDRHELERANWLLEHGASWHQADRRMALRLKRRASRRSRSEADAAETSHHDAKVHWIGARFVARGEDGSEKFARAVLLWLVLVPAIAVSLGPALLISAGLYYAYTTLALSLGRIPRSWPLYFGAGAALVAAALTWPLTRDGRELWTTTVWPEVGFDVDWAGVGLGTLIVQATVALALTGWHVRHRGWPGVITRKLHGFGTEAVLVHGNAASTPVQDPFAAVFDDDIYATDEVDNGHDVDEGTSGADLDDFDVYAQTTDDDGGDEYLAGLDDPEYEYESEASR